MKDTRVASRYAKSLFELAAERNDLERVKADMELFLTTMKENYQLVLALSSPILKETQKTAIVKSLFGPRFGELSLKLFALIASKHRDAILAPVAQEFINLYNKKHNISSVVVTTATALDDALRASITQLVASKTGGTAAITEKIDPSIIGGFILTMDSMQLDHSLRSKLAQVQQNLSDKSYTKAF